MVLFHRDIVYNPPCTRRVTPRVPHEKVRLGTEPRRRPLSSRHCLCVPGEKSGKTPRRYTRQRTKGLINIVRRRHPVLESPQRL